MSCERALALAAGLALACAAKPAVEVDASEPRAEPLVFVEAAPDPVEHAGLSGVTTAASQEPGPSERDREHAKLLYMEGMQRYEMGDHAGALELFERAYQLVRMPALRFNRADGVQRSWMESA
jgi:hypothetical protein